MTLIATQAMQTVMLKATTKVFQPQTHTTGQAVRRVVSRHRQLPLQQSWAREAQIVALCHAAVAFKFRYLVLQKVIWFKTVSVTDARMLG